MTAALTAPSVASAAAPTLTTTLRARLLRCVPNANDLAHRTPFVLTSRDEELLQAVYDHGFLTAEIVELAFFPPFHAGGRRSPSSCAYERLRQLWLWGYVERVELPSTRRSGRRPYVYAIGKRAIPVLTARLGVSAGAVQQRRIGRLDDRSVDHDLQAARLWAALRRHVPTTRITRFRWLAERALRARRMRVTPHGSRFPLPFLPDGYAELDYPDGAVQCCVVEVDNGTLPLRRFRRKLAGFEAFLDQGLFRRVSGRDDFDVCVLVRSRQRMRHLHRAARDVVDEDRWGSYLFATFEALDPRTFPDGWWPLDREDEEDTCGLLFTAAYQGGDRDEHDEDDESGVRGAHGPTGDPRSAAEGEPR